MHLRPDNVIYNLADFFNRDLVSQDDTTKYITDISCYKEGRFSTKIMDSTVLCDCRISSKIAFSRQQYWMMYRLDSTDWKREYYDTNGTIIKIEYVKEIIPLPLHF